MPKIETVRDKVAWSYANLAMARIAVKDGCLKYEPLHYGIRYKLFDGLRSGRMAMRSLYYDERQKMLLPQACAYCGTISGLSIDHLVPRLLAGKDDGVNLVCACRSCNSSKQGRDLLAWMHSKGTFPSLYVLRRYLKLVALRCEELGIWDDKLESALARDLPFSLKLLPTKFPSLPDLRLWIVASSAAEISAPSANSEYSSPS